MRGNFWLGMDKEIKEIAHNILTQDNRITQDPIFAVQQKRFITGIDLGYSDQVCWITCEGYIITHDKDPEEWERLEKYYDDNYDEPEDYIRTGYHEEWEFVTACLTEKGCEDYIARNGHNLSEPRIYAYGSYRNDEWRLIRKLLLNQLEDKLTLETAKSIARASENCSWRCISYIFTGKECQMTGRDLVHEAKQLLGDDYEVGRYCRNCLNQRTGRYRGEPYHICGASGSEFYSKKCPDDGCDYFCKNITEEYNNE